MARHRSNESHGLPQALVHLIHAAKKSGTDSEGSDFRGIAAALQELGELALWALPIHGVFTPNNNDVDVIITRIASEYLGLKEVRREFSEALRAVELFDRRDPIETAHNHVHTVSEAAYYYAGLAFGVTLTDFS